MRKVIINIMCLILFFVSAWILFQTQTPGSDYFEVDKKKVNIVGLNFYSKEDLISTKNVIEDFFGIECEIQEPINITYDYILFDCNVVQEQFGNSTKFVYSGGDITIFVTDSDLLCNDVDVKGVSYGDQIYVESKSNEIKSTVIHELSHTFGLEHCENNCIMNTYSFNKWSKTKDEPNFCESCSLKLPKRP